MSQILTVDDSRSMRQVVLMTLKADGHDVYEAEDGFKALERAKETQFDLIITDISMPGMTGLELIQALRSWPNYKFTPILCLTTSTFEAMKQKGKQCKATGWVCKPFCPEKLLGVVHQLLD